MNDHLNNLKQIARRITTAQKMEGNLTIFENLGLDIDDVHRMASSVGLETEDLLLMETQIRVVVKSDDTEASPVADDDLPEEVSTEEAARILNVSKDTVLKFKQAGLLTYRNTAPPQSARPVFRFKKESVLKLRTEYRSDSPPEFRPHRQKLHSRKRGTGFSHVKYEDEE